MLVDLKSLNENAIQLQQFLTDDKNEQDFRVMWQAGLQYAKALSNVLGFLIEADYATFKQCEQQQFNDINRYNAVAFKFFKQLVERCVATSTNNNNKKPSDAFLSHTGDDKLYSLTLKELIEKLLGGSGKANVFLDVNYETGVKDGEKIDDALRKAMTSCRVGVVSISKAVRKVNADCRILFLNQFFLFSIV